MLTVIERPTPIVGDIDDDALGRIDVFIACISLAASARLAARRVQLAHAA